MSLIYDIICSGRGHYATQTNTQPSDNTFVIALLSCPQHTQSLIYY